MLCNDLKQLVKTALQDRIPIDVVGVAIRAEGGNGGQARRCREIGLFGGIHVVAIPQDAIDGVAASPIQ